MGFNIDADAGAWRDIKVIGNTESGPRSAQPTTANTLTPQQSPPARVEITLNLVISVANGTATAHIGGMTPAAVSEAASKDVAPRLIPTTARTLTEALEEWEASFRLSSCGDRTIHEVFRTVRLCLEDRGWKFPEQIDAAGVRAWLLKTKPKVKEKTLKHYRDRMKQLTRWLVRNDWLESDPLKGLEAVRVVRKQSRIVPTEDQIRSLILGSTDDWRKGDRWIVYLVAATTGLRMKSLRMLRRSMFQHRPDLGLAWLDLPANVLKQASGPKRVYLPRETALALEAHPQTAPDKWLCKVPKCANFDRDLNSAGLAKRQEINGPTLARHSLRHFANNRMKWAQTIKLEDRAKQNTHDTLRMTATVYDDSEHPDYGRKIYAMQPLLPDGFTPPSPKKGRKPVDRKKKIADTSSVTTAPDQPIKTDPCAVAPPPSAVVTNSVELGAAQRSVETDEAGASIIAEKLNGGAGSNPVTPIFSEKRLDIEVRADAVAFVQVIEALALQLGGSGVRIIVTVHASHPPAGQPGNHTT